MIRIGDIGQLLDIVVTKGKTVLLLGDVGIGKTTAVYRWAEEFAVQRGKKLVKYGTKKEYEKDEMLFVEIIPSRIEAVDLNGILRVIDNRAVYVPLDWAVQMNNHGGVIFVDEFTTASSDVEAALMKLVQERRAGDIVFNNDVIIVCAGNKETQNRLARKLSEPIRAGKVLILEVAAATVEEWIRYMTERNKINTDVFGFLLSNKQYFIYDEDLVKIRPRNWEGVVDVFGDRIVVGDEVTLSILNGYLGKEITAKLQAFLRYRDKIIKKEKLRDFTFNVKREFDEADNNVKILSVLQLIGESVTRYTEFLRYIAANYQELFMLFISSLPSDEIQTLVEEMDADKELFDLLMSIKRIRGVK